jgi:hypothetical protein
MNTNCRHCEHTSREPSGRYTSGARELTMPMSCTRHSVVDMDEASHGAMPGRLRQSDSWFGRRKRQTPL